MRRQVERSLLAAGVQREAGEGLSFRGTPVTFEVEHSGTAHVFLHVSVPEGLSQGACNLLRDNPDTGWSWAWRERAPARKVCLDVVTWTQVELLVPSLERARVGSRESSGEAQRATVVRTVPAVARCEEVGRALGWLYLHRDTVATRGERHVLGPGEPVFRTRLVASEKNTLTKRLREERRMVGSLLRRPDLARELARAWSTVETS